MIDREELLESALALAIKGLSLETNEEIIKEMLRFYIYEAKEEMEAKGK